MSTAQTGAAGGWRFWIDRGGTFTDIVARTPDGGEAEVDAAVAAAKAAFSGWSDASSEVRSDVLDRAGTLVMERREALGRLLSREEGKTLA